MDEIAHQKTHFFIQIVISENEKRLLLILVGDTLHTQYTYILLFWDQIVAEQRPMNDGRTDEALSFSRTKREFAKAFVGDKEGRKILRICCFCVAPEFSHLYFKVQQKELSHLHNSFVDTVVFKSY